MCISFPFVVGEMVMSKLVDAAGETLGRVRCQAWRYRVDKAVWQCLGRDVYDCRDVPPCHVCSVGRDVYDSRICMVGTSMISQGYG